MLSDAVSVDAQVPATAAISTTTLSVKQETGHMTNYDPTPHRFDRRSSLIQELEPRQVQEQVLMAQHQNGSKTLENRHTALAILSVFH